MVYTPRAWHLWIVALLAIITMWALDHRATSKIAFAVRDLDSVYSERQVEQAYNIGFDRGVSQTCYGNIPTTNDALNVFVDRQWQADRAGLLSGKIFTYDSDVRK